LLVDAAEKIGVRMLWSVSVKGIEDHAVKMQSGSMSAHWIVGADGGQSSVRRWAGLSEVRHESLRFGFRSHYPIQPWSPYMELHWDDGCQLYVTPVAAGEVCLVLMSRDPKLRIQDALPRFPAVYERLRGIHASTSERGALAATCRLERITRGHIALVGDASGAVDPITGEGVCLAFRQSVVLAAALDAGDLNLYEREHARLVRRPMFMAGLMLSMDRSSWLRRRALGALSARPQLFANLLAAHVGPLKLGQFAATAASLGWEIAAT
jgi:2-polyprenyl-6-methoxyphenol hydroxylase-like FAD-dependent oxidoreductase